MFLFVFCLINLLHTAVSNTTESTGNITTRTNKLSTCSYNELTKNLLCYTQMYENLVQYHNVQSLAMCDYHYCIILVDSENRMSCSGYVLQFIGGDSSTFINPLSPNNQLIGFSANSADIFKIGKSFLGYNIMIDSFNQNVETEFQNDIELIECIDPHAMCVSFKGENKTKCFGSYGLVFYDQTSSVLFGLLIPGVFSFVFYSIIGMTCTKPGFSIKRALINTIILPIIVVASSILVIFKAEKLIVQTNSFIEGTILGILFGYVLSELSVKCMNCILNRSNKNVENYKISEEKQSLKIDIEEFEIGHNDIDDDDDDEQDEDKIVKSTSIELSQKNK